MKFMAGAVVLLGAALRVFPIWFGLPYSRARPDETEALGYAVQILAGGDANPHFFHWPSLTFYVFAGLFAVLGRLRDTLEFADYAIAARAAVAIAGTTTLVLVLRLAQRITDTRTAIVAAFLLAVAPLHVRESHFAMTDVLMTMFAVGCLAMLVREDGRSSWGAALAGLAGGLAASTKYSAAALAVAGLTLPRAPWRSRTSFVLAFAAGFLAATPFAVGDFATFRADVLFTRAHLAAGHVGESVGPGWIYHLRYSLPYGLGIPVLVASVPGAVLLALRHRRAAWILAAFAVPFFLAVGSGRTVFFRYVLPLLPLACVAAAIAIRALADRVAPAIGARAAVATAVVAVAIAAVPLRTSITLDRLLARTDTRVLAAEWLGERLRADDTLYDAGGAYAKLELGRTAFHEWRYDPATNRFVNAGDRTPDWLVLYDYAAPLRHYASTDPRVLALAKERYSLAFEVTGIHDNADAVFDRDDAFFLPMAGFRGVERPGPEISIYRRVR